MLEQAGEMPGIPEAEFLVYLINGRLLIHDVLLRQVDDLVLDVAFCRDVQGVVLGAVEKGIVVDALGQRCAVNQIRME